MSEARLGILTGGGDVPGLNSVIKSVVYRSLQWERSVIGIRRGWEGLTHLEPDGKNDADYIVAAAPREHSRHRPDGWHRAAHLPHQSLAHDRFQASGTPSCSECLKSFGRVTRYTTSLLWFCGTWSG